MYGSVGTIDFLADRNLSKTVPTFREHTSASVTIT